MKHVTILLYCMCIGMFLNQEWFNKQQQSKHSKREQQYIEASLIGFKMRKVLLVSVPTVAVLLWMNHFI